ncbi:MAG: hypothetical protein KF745_00440 [Phycisphaeraceae bacterium]|nr:hypothetical protein [Phycisphaeraceae bacterium]
MGMMRMGVAGVVAAGCMAGAASAQVLINEGFENSSTSGWTVNGATDTLPGGNPGDYLSLPYLDFWGITLRTDEPGNPALGDLTQYPGLRFRVDMRTFQANNFFGDPLDTSAFPLVLEFVNTSDGGYRTVYFVGDAVPGTGDGWVTYEFVVPNPSQAALPPGWGGTGDEDPETFEPILPAGWTYSMVLSDVSETRITTFQPGYFYSANFWEVGFDNLLVEVVTPTCPADADGNGVIEPADVATFINSWFSGVTNGTLDGDFDGNGAVEPTDIAVFISAWLSALSGGC